MSTSVYDKTDKGREEIATRKYHLPPRLRTLLVMIDGKRGIDLLMNELGAMGLNEASFHQLLNEDYIRLVSGAPAAPVAAAPVRASAPPSPAPVAPPVIQETPAPSVQAVPQREHEAEQMDDSARFRALYDFYNQTIKSTIGLRGFTLQLKVEKCANIEDFRALRQTYLEAVLKARGTETALSMRSRLDQLLGGAPADDPVHIA